MLPTVRIRTASLLGIALIAVFVLSAALTGCCSSDEWKTVPFKQAHLKFTVPADWTVRFRQPGSDPVTVEDGDMPGDANASDGAVLTALPVLEDAALVILVAESDVKPEYFARQVESFIPLEATTFSSRPEPYTINGLAGYAGEGTGRLPGEDTDVYFRTLVLGVAGRTVLVTLYAEASHKVRYEAIFDHILASLAPEEGTPPSVVETPDAGARPSHPRDTVDAQSDASDHDPSAPDASTADAHGVPAPEGDPDIPGPEGEELEPDEGGPEGGPEGAPEGAPAAPASPTEAPVPDAGSSPPQVPSPDVSPARPAADAGAPELDAGAPRPPVDLAP